MSSDVFGNLRDWGIVLDKLEELKKSGMLDKHQKGLIRILRFKKNWRLRQTVIEAVKDLKMPCDQIILEVLDILLDENIYNEMRILAANALIRMLKKHKARPGSEESVFEDKVVEKMNTVLDIPGAPVIHNTVRGSLASIKER